MFCDGSSFRPARTQSAGIDSELAASNPLVETTMSSSVGLPPEMLDLVVDHLHDQPATLKSCCLVSKSWISRARTHLFSSVNFHARRSPVKLWMETFPDPSNSPASYTRTLSICNLSIVAATGTSARPWIHAFCYLVELGVDTSGLDDTEISLIPLHGLSPTLRSLHIFHSITPLSEIFHLICSFHFLEDLTLMSDIDGKPDGWTVPSTSPKFTGTLYLGVKPRDGVLHTVRHLLDLPRGLHFSKILVSYPSEDVESTAGLVSRCFGTLESLHLSCLFLSAFPPLPNYLSISSRPLMINEQQRL